MMRAALWFVGLFALAVASALFAGNNDGIVTLFFPPYRVDLSLNMALLLLGGSFVLLHAALRGFALLGNMPLQARRWRLQQKERAMYQALVESLAHQQAGRFVRSRRAAQHLLKLSEELRRDNSDALPDDSLRAMAHMLAADSAHALQDLAARDAHFAQALEHAPAQGSLQQQEVREGAQLRAARWALDDRSPQLALERLAQLPHGTARRTMALRIKLKAARLAHATPMALETARLLAKHGGFSQASAHSIIRGLLTEQIHHSPDSATLQTLWESLSPAEQAMPDLAVTAAQRLVALGGDCGTARHWLRPTWELYTQSPQALDDAQVTRLVSTLQRSLDGLDDAWLARIEAALHHSPQNPQLQYLAGMACLQRQLWGKAEQLLQQAVKRLPTGPLPVSAWKALALLAEQRADTEAAAQAWRQAVLQVPD